MKKNFTLVLGLVLLASCSGDGNESTIDKSKLIKKWYFSDAKIAGEVIPIGDHEECGKDYIEFIASGVLNDVDVWDCEIYEDEGSWTLAGNKLTISFPEEGAQEATVSKLTDTALEITFKDSEIEGGPEITVVQTFTIN
jgi:hypothetical protein